MQVGLTATHRIIRERGETRTARSAPVRKTSEHTTERDEMKLRTEVELKTQAKDNRPYAQLQTCNGYSLRLGSILKACSKKRRLYPYSRSAETELGRPTIMVPGYMHRYWCVPTRLQACGLATCETVVEGR